MCECTNCENMLNPQVQSESKIKSKNFKRYAAVLFFIFIFLFAGLATWFINGCNSRSINCPNCSKFIRERDSYVISQWTFQSQSENSINKNTEGPLLLVEKLRKIRETAAVVSSESEIIITKQRENQICDVSKETEFCYTEECLDAALTLLKSINFTVDPCDNFYEFACGRWVVENPVPPTEYRWGSYDNAEAKISKIVQEILKSPTDGQLNGMSQQQLSDSHPMAMDSKPMKQAKEYYALCMNEVELERKGLAPLLEILEPYGGWPVVTTNWNSTKFDINIAIADAHRLFNKEILLEPYLANNSSNSSQYIYYLAKPDKFSLPKSVLLNPEKFMLTMNAYKSYFFNVAKEFAKVTGASIKVEELQVQFNDILEFETRVLMANESQSEDKDSFNNSTNGDNQLIFNENTVASERQAIQFELKTVLNLLFYTSSGDTIDPATYASTFSVDENYISNLTKILHSTKVQTVANYFTWRLITIYGHLTTKKMTDLQFEFQKVKFGLTKQVPKGERCGENALAMFNKALSSKYLEINREYNAKVKVTVLEMVKQLSASFQDMLSEAQWIDDRTEKAATAKLKAIKKFVSYPNWMFDQNRLERIYEEFNIVPGDYFGTTLRGWGLDTNRTLIPLSATPNANSWRGSPLEANAYYYRTYNSLTIAAGIVQPPFYRNNCLESLNYGGIGTTIGHEIGHGFDVSGSHYDSQGNWHRWWNSSTLTEFLDKVHCFVNEYSELKTEVGPVNGISTVNENIADNVGVRVAFRAYQKWIQKRNGGKEEPKLPGLEMFTSTQLFFLGFANKRCETATKEYLEYIINEDTHSPDQFRVVLPLQNFKEFAQHWNCPIGSPMNPPPKDQCVLW